MPNSTYKRPVKTVSRTQLQRRLDNRLLGQIANGTAPPLAELPPPAAPLRPGLRNKRYNYAGHDPKVVDPEKASSTSAGLIANAAVIPVPHLEGQQG